MLRIKVKGVYIYFTLKTFSDWRNLQNKQAKVGNEASILSSQKKVTEMGVVVL
jgi:hypothetical protein